MVTEHEDLESLSISLIVNQVSARNRNIEYRHTNIEKIVGKDLQGNHSVRLNELHKCTVSQKQSNYDTYPFFRFYISRIQIVSTMNFALLSNL